VTWRAFFTFINREWSVAWKNRSGYIQRALYGGLLLLSGAGFAIFLLFDHGTGRGVTFSDLFFDNMNHLNQRDVFGTATFADISVSFFYYLSLGQFLLLTFLGTVTFTRSLTREKEGDTLDLLIVSPVWRFELLFGKVMGDFIGILAVLAAGVPFFCFFLVLGGVTLSELISVHLILLGQLAFVAGLSMLLTVFFSSYYAVTAMVWSFIFGFLFLGAGGQELFPSTGPTWIFLRNISPFFILENELSTVWSNFGPSTVVFFSGFSFLLFFCFIGGLVLDRQNDKRKSKGENKGIFRRVKGGFSGLAETRWIRGIFPSFAGCKHPLTRRECNLRQDKTFILGWLIFVGLYLGFMIVAMVAEPKYRFGYQYKNPAEEFHIGMGATGILVTTFSAFVFSALSVFNAKKTRRFEVLLAVNIEPETIVRSKLSGLLLRAGYLLAIPLAHVAITVFVISPGGEVFKILIGICGLVCCVFVGIFLTMAVSLGVRSPVTALIRTIVIAVPVSVIAGSFVGASFTSLMLSVPLIVPFLLGTYAWNLRGFRKRVLSR